MPIPVLCMDYGFMREKPKEAGEDLRSILVMLVSKDHAYGVRRMVQYIEKVLGYKRLAIKGDQELAL